MTSMSYDKGGDLTLVLTAFGDDSFSPAWLFSAMDRPASCFY